MWDLYNNVKIKILIFEDRKFYLFNECIGLF